MRPGPPTEMLGQPLRMGAHFSVVYGGETTVVDLPVYDARIEWTRLETQSTPKPAARLTFRLPADWCPESIDDAVAPGGHRIRVDATLSRAPGGDTWTTPLGQWLVTEVAPPSDGQSIQVTAWDMTQVVHENSQLWPSSPEPHATILSELHRLSPTTEWVMDDGITDRRPGVGTQLGRDTLAACRDLAAGARADIVMGGDGRLHLRPWRTSADLPDAYYGRGQLVSATRLSPAGGRRANVIAVTGSHTESTGRGDGRVEQVTRWTAVRDAGRGPYGPEVYGRVVSHRELSGAESYEDVRGAADTDLEELMHASDQWSLTVVPDPRIEIGDVVAAQLSDGDVVAGRVRGFQLPLTDPDERMRIDIDRMD